MTHKFRVIDAIRISLWRIRNVGNGGIIPNIDSIREDPENPDVAVCCIAVGRDYIRMAHMMIKSLRVNGRFNGPVFIFTDEPALFSDVENSMAFLIPAKLSIMGIKQYKTWITELPFQYLLYLDADIVIGENVRSWIDEAKEAACKHPIVLFFDHAAGEKYFHGGVFLVHRQTGNKILQKWRRQIWYKGYSRDQKALKRSIKSEKDVYLMPGEGLNFVGQTDGCLKSVTVFNHITNRARKLLVPGKINRFLEKLNLLKIQQDGN